jgi:hypothetical protein
MHPIFRKNVDWVCRPSLAICCLFGAIALYILSLGPTLWLTRANGTFGWRSFPAGVRFVYAPLKSWVPSDDYHDTGYGEYLLWWINLQYHGKT